MNNYIKRAVAVAILLFSGFRVQAGLNFSSQSSTLHLSGASAALIVNTPLTGVNGTLSIDTKSATSLQQTTTDTIAFSNGIYQSSKTNKMLFDGVINPATTDTLELTAGQLLDVDYGNITEAILATGSGNEIRGRPTFGSTITLADGSAELILNIQHKLNTNVALAGGTLLLGDDLALEDGVYFTGNGTVDLQDHTLTLPAASAGWANTLTFLNANDINITGYTNFTGTFTFSGAAGSTRVNGNGCILDISGGGTLIVDTNHTLYLNDIIIKGLGANGGSLTVNATGGAVKMSNVTIILDGDYTQLGGTITAEGTNCLIVARDADQFIVSGATTTLVVDSVALLYDPLGSTPVTPDPFVTVSSGTISLINDGIIRPSYQDTLATSGDSFYDFASEVMGTSHVLAPESTITFNNDTVGTPKAIALNGQGNFIQFNYSTAQNMIIEENVTVTVTNMELKDFDPALINFQGAGGTLAKLVFGDNVKVSLNKDLTFSTKALEFVGNATLSGNGHTITLSAANMLTAGTASKTLTIKDTLLDITHVTAMECLTDTTKIVLQDSTVRMSTAGYTFNTGDLDVKNHAHITGLDPTTVGGVATFTFGSNGQLTVQSNSTLQVGRDVGFSYIPNIIADAGDPDLEKRHLFLTDPSSTFWVDSSLVTTGTMGFELLHGRLLVDGHTIFNIDATAGAEVEFGTALQVEISPGAIMDIDGALKYHSTTFP